MTIHLETNQIVERLEQAEREFSRRLGLREGVEITPSSDPMDRAQEAQIQHLAVRGLDHSVRTLQQIRLARHRLTHGGYGICADCEEPIAARRLMAVPWAHRCIGCQEAADRTGERKAGEEAATPQLGPWPMPALPRVPQRPERLFRALSAA